MVETATQPLLVYGYKRPDQYDKDDPVFDIMSLILSGGRTSWMYRELVDKRSAVAAQTAPAYPGGQHPSLFLFFLAPAQGQNVDGNRKALDDLLERFKTEKVDEQTLERVKAQARVQVLQRLDSNPALAGLLTAYHANYGDWRKLFTSLDEYKKVTAEDVQRVARQYFVTQNRTVAYTVPPAAPQQPAAGGRR
jgi:predicted Zn-dependent peptidase